MMVLAVVCLMQAISSQERSRILLDIADALQANEKQILAENEADVAAAQMAGYEKSLISRLAMKPEKARTDRNHLINIFGFSLLSDI